MQNGILISQIRTERGLSQLDVARLLHVTLTTYKLYEAGLRPMRIDELNILSNYFKVSLNALLGLSNNLVEFGPFDLDYKYLRFSLKYVRKMNRITQKALSKDLHVSVPIISFYEKHPEALKADYLYKFVQRFHVSADYICGKTMKKEVL